MDPASSAVLDPSIFTPEEIQKLRALIADKPSDSELARHDEPFDTHPPDPTHTTIPVEKEHSTIYPEMEMGSDTEPPGEGFHETWPAPAASPTMPSYVSRQQPEGSSLESAIDIGVKSSVDDKLDAIIRMAEHPELFHETELYEPYDGDPESPEALDNGPTEEWLESHSPVEEHEEEPIHDMSSEEIDEMVARLKGRLNKDDDDIQGIGEEEDIGVK